VIYRAKLSRNAKAVRSDYKGSQTLEGKPTAKKEVCFHHYDEHQKNCL
jgi:hypothetical protein